MTLPVLLLSKLDRPSLRCFQTAEDDPLEKRMTTENIAPRTVGSGSVRFGRDTYVPSQLLALPQKPKLIALRPARRSERLGKDV